MAMPGLSPTDPRSFRLIQEALEREAQQREKAAKQLADEQQKRLAAHFQNAGIDINSIPAQWASIPDSSVTTGPIGATNMTPPHWAHNLVAAGLAPSSINAIRGLLDEIELRHSSEIATLKKSVEELHALVASLMPAIMKSAEHQEYVSAKKRDRAFRESKKKAPAERLRGDKIDVVIKDGLDDYL